MIKPVNNYILVEQISESSSRGCEIIIRGRVIATGLDVDIVAPQDVVYFQTVYASCVATATPSGNPYWLAEDTDLAAVDAIEE